ncbi:MAG: hypothetical protein ACK579_15125 [Dolichospermum sp.]
MTVDSGDGKLLLPITYYPLPITYYPLPITYYPLPKWSFCFFQVRFHPF